MAFIAPIKLFDGQTANGTSVISNVYTGVTSAVIQAGGVFGSSTVQVQISLDGVTWTPVSDLSGIVFNFTAPIVFGMVVSEGMRIRMVLSGATGTTNVNVLLTYRRGA